MKMPKGWKRITEATIKMRKWEESVRPGDRFATFDYPWCGDITEAMVFLRDMANVLEGFAGKEGYEEVNKILTEFQEWK